MKALFNFTFDKRSLQQFTNKCEATIRNVGAGTKRAAIEACEDILRDSLAEVPRKTNTLASTAYYEVKRRTDVGPKTYAYEGTVGYGKMNKVNPRTRRHVRGYMVAVHERLDVSHPVGKAKFLEDPVRRYGSKFPRTVYNNIKDSLR